MTARRIPALLVLVAAALAIIAVGRRSEALIVPVFGEQRSGWMPAAPSSGLLTESWFCPGVPATGFDEVEGELVVSNLGGEQLNGSMLLINDRRESVQFDLVVEPYAVTIVDLDATLPGGFVGAVVEIDGGGAIVEQRVARPSGDSASACANQTSDSWFLADGFTVDGSLDQILLSNPSDQVVVADLEFATSEGSRAPAAYSGLTIAPRSIRVVDLGAIGAGAQEEPMLAVKVVVARGRLVVGRSQRYLGGGRLGTQVTVASPSPRDQWWFADGAKGVGIDQQFSIYNPGDDDVEVDAVFLGISQPIAVDPIVVPAHQVVAFDSGSVLGLPDGHHSVVFFESSGAQSIIVERVLTTTVGDDLATSVIAGATARPDGYIAKTWYVAAAPSSVTLSALRVFNVDNAPGTVSVFVVRDGGLVPLAGLQNLAVLGASAVTLDLTDEAAFGRGLVIESTARVLVERSFPTGRGGTRSASWATPLDSQEW